MKEYGLVLAGGGAKGGYEIGVYKYLLQNNINIKAIAGASVGALNGAIIAQGDYEKGEELWNNINMQNVINLEKVNFKDIIENRGLDVTPLKELMMEYIDEEKIRNSKIDLGLITFSLSDFKPLVLTIKEIPKGMLIDYLLASASFPIFKPQEIDGKTYIDGGIYDNIPISILGDMGVKDVIRIDISGPGRNRKTDESLYNIIDIKNSAPLGRTLNFNGKRSKKNIELGFIDAAKVFENIKTKKYYIEYFQDKLTLPLDLKEYDLIKNSISDKFINYIFTTTLKDSIKDTLTSSNYILAMEDIAASVFEIDLYKKYNSLEIAKILLEEYKNIINSPLYNINLHNLKEGILNGDIKNLDKRYISLFSVLFDEDDKYLLFYRKLLGITNPKLLIANILISLLVLRQGS